MATSDRLHDYYAGIPIFETPFLPKDRALLIDDVGRVVQIYILKTWRTKKDAQHKKRK